PSGDEFHPEGNPVTVTVLVEEFVFPSISVAVAVTITFEPIALQSMLAGLLEVKSIPHTLLACAISSNSISNSSNPLNSTFKGLDVIIIGATHSPHSSSPQLRILPPSIGTASLTVKVQFPIEFSPIKTLSASIGLKSPCMAYDK